MSGSRRIGARAGIARFFALAGALAVGGFTATADAQATQSVSQSIAATQYPAAFVARPINLRGGMIRIDTRYQHLEENYGGVAFTDNQLAVGAAIGISDSIEIGVTHARLAGLDDYANGALVASFHGNHNTTYGDVNIYGRYGFIDAEDFKISGEIAVVVPTRSASDWQFVFGLPVRARLGEHFALDLLPEIRIAFGETSTGTRDTDLSLNVPVAGVLQLNNNIWLAGRSGMYWTDFALDTFHFPAILEAGFTLDHAGAAILDVAVQGGFPKLFEPGGNDPVRTDLWMLRVNLTGYIAL